jgi:hypothetical protein
VTVLILARRFERPAVERGAVTPQFGWGSMATTEKDTLAYLTVRQNDLAPDGSKLYEIGVISHGPSSDVLGDQVVDAIRTWDRGYRSHTADFEIHPTDAPLITPAPGRFCVDTPNGRIIIGWR